MKAKTYTFACTIILLLVALAGQSNQAQARDNFYLGADLGGLLVHFDNYPRRVWVPPPPPPPVYYGGERRTVVVYDDPPPRGWHHRHHWRHRPYDSDEYRYDEYRHNNRRHW
jgi:hypothetical protein